MMTEDTDQHQQCKLFEPAVDEAREEMQFGGEKRFSLPIENFPPNPVIKLFPPTKPGSEITVLSDDSISMNIFSVPVQNDPVARHIRKVRSSPQITDVSIEEGTSLWYDQGYVWHDLVLACIEPDRVSIYNRRGSILMRDWFPVYNCKPGIVHERNGECFGLVRKKDGHQARLHLIEKMGLIEYRQSIPIDDESKPGVLSEDCTMHAQKTKNGIRVTDIKNGGITKEIHLDGMEPGQIMFFDDASKVIVSAEGDHCRFQVMDVHSGATLDTTGVPTFEGCTNIVRSQDGTLIYLNHKQRSTDPVRMNVIRCNQEACSLEMSSDVVTPPEKRQMISLPNPNSKYVIVSQRSDQMLFRRGIFAIVDLENGALISSSIAHDLPKPGIQWISEDAFIKRDFQGFGQCTEVCSIEGTKIVQRDYRHLGYEDMAVLFSQCSQTIQMPFDGRIVCIGDDSFALDMGSTGDHAIPDNRITLKDRIEPDLGIDSNHHFSIDGKWLITFEEHPSDEGKGLLKWFHGDSLDLYRSCEYSKSRIERLETIQSCWIDKDANVYSDDSKIKVQRIGVGILDEMDIGYVPLALQCANGFVLTSSDSGTIDAWNVGNLVERGRVVATAQGYQIPTETDSDFAVTDGFDSDDRSDQLGLTTEGSETLSDSREPVRVRSQRKKMNRTDEITVQGFRIEPEVISNHHPILPVHFSLDRSWPPESTQTESVLAYRERVRTPLMRAERGNMTATAEGYRSQASKMPRGWMIACIGFAVLLIPLLISLLIWIRVRRAGDRRRNRMSAVRSNRIVMAHLHPITEGERSQTMQKSENECDHQDNPIEEETTRIC